MSVAKTLVSPGHDGYVTARAVTVRCWSAEIVVGFCIGHLALPGTSEAGTLVRAGESVQLQEPVRRHSLGQMRWEAHVNAFLLRRFGRAAAAALLAAVASCRSAQPTAEQPVEPPARPAPVRPDRKSTRLNSSHSQISYAVF